MAGPKTDRRQQHGEISRQRILDATVEIAAERGYEGTSISLVSKRSGLPASSIYWHFKDKDHLLAAVMERSYQLWQARLSQAWEAPEPGADRAEALSAMSRAISTSLLEQPEFLRLGMMLTLERRPVEAKARELFTRIRAEVHGLAVTEFERVLADVPEERRTDLARRLATFTLAASDGLFLAYHLDPDGFDLVAEFEMLSVTVDAALGRWIPKA
ncbi:helix-turn-helix domain-containing protein [Actinocorallia sp. B10E7]|uniref:TetR/AcrR family transcriptional regulator n=1 Tax=Actinocorallia sp. B10E7 TaxID=3153558 RepID=UPI00325E4316